jgi:hypothetical protein
MTRVGTLTGLLGPNGTGSGIPGEGFDTIADPAWRRSGDGYAPLTNNHRWPTLQQ